MAAKQATLGSFSPRSKKKKKTKARSSSTKKPARKKTGTTPSP